MRAIGTKLLSPEIVTLRLVPAQVETRAAFWTWWWRYWLVGTYDGGKSIGPISLWNSDNSSKDKFGVCLWREKRDVLRRIRVVEMPLRGINARQEGVRMTRFAFHFQTSLTRRVRNHKWEICFRVKIVKKKFVFHAVIGNWRSHARYAGQPRALEIHF